MWHFCVPLCIKVLSLSIMVVTHVSACSPIMRLRVSADPPPLRQLLSRGSGAYADIRVRVFWFALSHFTLRLSLAWDGQ